MRVVKVVDVPAWAYWWLTKEQARYSRNTIVPVCVKDFCADAIKGADVVYFSSPTLTALPLVNKMIATVRRELPNAKIIGSYAAETNKLYTDVDAVVAVSLKQLDFLERSYPGIPVIFLPEGIDTKYFVPGKTKRRNFKVGYAGRVGPPKRDYLLKQLAYPVTMQCNHGPKFFKASRTQRNMLDFYQSIDCLVLCSSSECQPRVVLEAMACGVPVVSTDVGTLSSFMPAHWLVPVNPEKECVAAINTRLKALAKSQKQRKDAGNLARTLVARSLAWEVVQPAWDSAFELVGHSNRALDLLKRVTLAKFKVERPDAVEIRPVWQSDFTEEPMPKPWVGDKVHMLPVMADSTFEFNGCKYMAPNRCEGRIIQVTETKTHLLAVSPSEMCIHLKKS